MLASILTDALGGIAVGAVVVVIVTVALRLKNRKNDAE